MSDKDKAMEIAEAIALYYRVKLRGTSTEGIAAIIRPMLPRPVEVAEDVQELAREIDKDYLRWLYSENTAMPDKRQGDTAAKIAAFCEKVERLREEKLIDDSAMKEINADIKIERLREALEESSKQVGELKHYLANSRGEVTRLRERVKKIGREGL